MIEQTKSALKQHLSSTPEFLEQCLNIVDGKVRVDNGLLKSKIVSGARGDYYKWVRVEDNAIQEIGEEEGNYAGGVVWRRK